MIADRVRRLRNGTDDGGFALLFVVFVTTVVLIGVVAVLSVVSGNITAAKRGQDAAGASAAARSGIDDVIAYLVSIPSCRSESRICTAALPQDPSKPVTSDSLAAQGKARPSLGNGQSFSWSIYPYATADGYVRVTSVGKAGCGDNQTGSCTTRTLVADLSLRASILAYGYYSDYETQPSSFFTSYDTAGRKIYIASPTVWSNVSSGYRGNASAPQTATWNGPTNTARCDRHWYAENGVAGRATNGTTFGETGSVNGNTTSQSSTCDLVFTSAMTEDGMTYSRDALNISAAGGTGPQFNQPVYTMWGYNDGNKKVFATPAPPAGKTYRGDTISNAGYKPTVAPTDLVLPKSIGTDGLADNSCVYSGPTRVVLNGDGTATVTSPYTSSDTIKNESSDPNCYPTAPFAAGDIVNWRMNYQSAGSGTIRVKNLNSAPTGGWPATTTKSTQTPGSGNEVFWFPLSGNATASPSMDLAPSSSCSSSNLYSNASNATCAWTNVATANDATSTTGWSAYSSTTNCNSTSLGETDRQLFECNYAQVTGSRRPGTDQYAAFRSVVQSYASRGICTTGSIDDQVGCLKYQMQGDVAKANTGGRPYSYATPANGDRRYYVMTSAGPSTTSAPQTIGTAPANPTPNDPLFTYSATPATQTSTTTPIYATVYRQTYNTANKTSDKWTIGTPQFTTTVTDTDWTLNTQAKGASYFPNEQDVTAYNTGATNNVTAGSAGTSQPGDLYVEGKNSGKLSLIAQNDVVVTGNLTNPVGYSANDHAVSIVAGDDVRNYHPVSCTDQTASDINNTTAGFCPNDISGLTGNGLVDGTNNLNASHPAKQYTNMQAIGDRSIDAAVFALTGSFRTDNYDRGVYVGNLTINGGLYQSHRGANGVQYQGNGYLARSGTTLIYHFVDLQRANLPYVPPASSGNYLRPWNIVSLSAG